MPRQRRFLDHEELAEIQSVISWQFRDPGLLKGAFDSLDHGSYGGIFDYMGTPWSLQFLSMEGKNILRQELVKRKKINAYSPSKSNI